VQPLHGNGTPTKLIAALSRTNQTGPASVSTSVQDNTAQPIPQPMPPQQPQQVAQAPQMRAQQQPSIEQLLGAMNNPNFGNLPQVQQKIITELYASEMAKAAGGG